MKKIVLSLIFMACIFAQSLTGCGTGSTNPRGDLDILQGLAGEEGNTTDADIPATESTANIVSTDEMYADEALRDNIYNFQNQFLDYGSLCLNMPGSYGAGGFNEQTRLEMIGFSEGKKMVLDSEPVDYSHIYPYIRPERVRTLANRFFGRDLDLSSLEIGDFSPNLFSNNSFNAYEDANGGIIVNLGDWGDVYPISTKCEITYNKDFIYAKNHIAMFSEDRNAQESEIGSYTIVLDYNKENPYEYTISDFFLSDY